MRCKAARGRLCCTEKKHANPGGASAFSSKGVTIMHYATELPLHGGKAPRWLFQRMVKLGDAICTVIIDEYGPGELVARLSDSNWFQALACAIGYDWHSSGTTTVTMGALKEALNSTGSIYIAGGKGKAGLKTPEEIKAGTDVLSIPGEDERFAEFSRLAAKIDSSMIYDNIGIYHHSFIFSSDKKWAVVQQAMPREGNKAIRFQWFSGSVNASDITNEPHTCVSSELHVNSMDLTYSQNEWVKKASIEALKEYDKIVKKTSYPERHGIIAKVDVGRRGMEAIKRAGELDPQDYRDLLLIKGVGRATIRSLAFVSSLIYGKELAYRDPVTFAYNVGGKDKIPFEINRRGYDELIETMCHIIDAARIEKGEKYKILKRLNSKFS